MSNDFIGHGMQHEHLLMHIPKATIAHLSLKFMADESWKQWEIWLMMTRMHFTRFIHARSTFSSTWPIDNIACMGTRQCPWDARKHRPLDLLFTKLGQNYTTGVYRMALEWIDLTNLNMGWAFQTPCKHGFFSNLGCSNMFQWPGT